MADWKTYAKAARNTARRRAPEAKDAARRASGQAGAYVRAAGRAIDEGRRSDDARRPSDDRPSSSRTSTASRPSLDRDRLRKDAAAYYTVASRHVERVNIVPRVMRALRDALLIGLSLFIIWGVLFAAGIPIPFTTVLIIVGIIVVISFASGLYAQWKRAEQARRAAEDPRDR